MKIKETELKYEHAIKLPKSLVDAIDVGLDDVKAGRVIPHKEAMKQIREELGFAHL